MAVKLFLAIFINELGYVFDNHRSCRYVEKPEDASLYQDMSVVNDVINEYDFKKGEYTIRQIPVFILDAKPQDVVNTLVVSVKSGETEQPVFSMPLATAPRHLAQTIRNADNMLHIMFAGSSGESHESDHL